MRIVIFFILIINSLSAFGLSLGQGHFENNWTPECVSGKKRFSGYSEGILKVDHSYMSSDELVHVLSKSKASFDLFLFGADGLMTINSVIRKGKKHWYFVSEFEISQKTEVLDLPSWTSFGLEVLRLNDSEVFKSLCGDEFVGQLTRKKRIYAVFQYNFAVAQSKTDVTAKIKVKTFFGSITETHRTTVETGTPLESIKVFFIGEGIDLSPIMSDVTESMNLCGETNIEFCDQAGLLFIKIIRNPQFINSLADTPGVPSDFVFYDYSVLRPLNVENKNGN